MSLGMRRCAALAALLCLALAPRATAAELRTFTIARPPERIVGLAGSARPVLVQGLGTRWSLNRRAVLPLDHAVPPDHRPVERGAELGRALLRRVVDVVDAD